LFEEKDFIKKQLQQLAQFLKRLLSKAREEGDVDTAMDDLRREAEKTLGMPLHFLDIAEPASAVTLLRSREKVEAYVEILLAQAQLSELLGDGASAQMLRQRAEAVRAVIAP